MSNSIPEIADTDAQMMRRALALAARAAAEGEVPVGCVITRGGSIIAEGRNRTEGDRRVLRHAELCAIEAACAALGGWRLNGCTLYVTLEPCPMCAGAIVFARLPRVVFGAKDSRAGSFGSLLDLRAYPLPSRPEVTGGVLGDECSALLREFFAARRRGEAGK